MIGIVAAVSLMLASGQATAADPGAFCERMATRLEMSPVRGKPGAPVVEWRKNAFTAVQRLLTGGSSLISFGMRPVGTPTVDDYQRLQAACQQQGKEILCRVDEPMVLVVSTGKMRTELEAGPGERAEVGTKGSRLFCRVPST